MSEEYETEISNLSLADLILSIIVLILFLLALVGNGILIAAYLRDQRMRTPTNMLVISHSSAEFLFAITGIPVYGSSLIQFKILPNYICIFIGTISMFLFFVSVLSLAAISVDRYFAVVRRSHHKFKKKTVLRVLVFIWSLAALSAVPWDLVLIQKPGKRFIAWLLGSCERYLSISEHDNVPVITLRISLWSVSFFIPSFVMFCTCIRILRSTLQTRVRVHVIEFRGAADAYTRSARTTIIIIAVYFLCLTPGLVFFILRKLITAYYSISLHSIAKVAMSIRSVCYPLIFILRNRKFSEYVRSFVVKTLNTFRCPKPQPSSKPPELELGPKNIYFPNPLRTASFKTPQTNRNELSRARMFRGAPRKSAFTDLSNESENQG